ncbi:Fe2+-enterobactin ABC transporter substrate-binding protein [Streptomonospora sp. S1-112]|uniref:Fe2+-enterobactin ABC transporter substrate-binding protein n=1 Tax=Streptomonospora mangrovi TaxID=2883123 RepID=A0A9X3NNZ3_9ACTN|nr:Fe2+-enterobactin ABC transporter substrate-binding protein [Streptomonospora mangrovi]MDA0566813.1 Fe2+-enterobactin ABC transporter substrate-binding protein [Streptomonospora mangrovi]
MPKFASVLVAAVLVPVAGCSAGGPDDSGQSETPTRTVEHLFGSSDIPADPQRVVSVSVTSTASLLSLDVPVVASGTTAPSGLTDDSGFFAQWAEVAHERGVEALPGPEVDLEAVAAAEPDVIVGNGFGADAVDEAAYDRLSQLAPTVVLGESDTSWLELTEETAAVFGAEEAGAEVEREYADLVEETSGRLDTGHDVVVLTGTPHGFNVFTEESALGGLVTDLGLTLHEFAEGEAVERADRADTVEVAHENASAFGDSTLLFVNTQDEAVEDYLETAPNLAETPAYREDRAFTLGAESFRMDHYSIPLVAERLTEVLGD